MGYASVLLGIINKILIYLTFNILSKNSINDNLYILSKDGD